MTKATQEFHNKIEKWLGPLGYKEHFRNHPNLPISEFHYIKDNIRVICSLEPFTEGSFCLHTDIINLPQSLSIKTGNYPIQTPEFNNLLGTIKTAREKLVQK